MRRGNQLGRSVRLARHPGHMGLDNARMTAALPAPPERLALPAAQHTYPRTILYAQDYRTVVYDSATDSGSATSCLLASGKDWLPIVVETADGERTSGRFDSPEDGWIRITHTSRQIPPPV